jgi:hypothetical protein
MKLHKSVYKVLFLLYIIVQTAFPSVELSVLLSGGLLFGLLSLEPLKISRSLSVALSYLLAIITLGVLTSLFYNYGLFDRVRDLLHFIKPILMCFLAYLLVVRIGNTRYVLRLLVFFALFLALRHLIALALVDYSTELRIDQIRGKAGASSFIELVALVVLLAFRKENSIVGPQSRRLFIFLLSISFITYFSRTMILGLIVFLLSIYGYTKLTRKAFEYSVVILCLFGLFFAYLFTLDLDQDEEGLNKFLYKLQNAPGEVFVSPENYDPRDHKAIFNHWRGYEAYLALKQMEGNPMNYVSGKGFGALVDLGFKAPLGGIDGLRYIPHLHNGYMYIFFKVGLIGLIFYLVFLFNLYKQVYFASSSSSEANLRKIVSGFALYFFASSLVVTGIYNLSEISIFCLGIFIALVHLEAVKSKPVVHE